MDKSWEKWLSDLGIMDDCHLFTEYDIKYSLEEELKGENSVQPALCRESHSPDSNFTCAATSNMDHFSISLEENIGFDNNTSEIKQHDSSEKSLFSFEDSTAVPNNIPNKTSQHHDEHSEETKEEKDSRKHKRGRSASQSRDHNIAEKKRRENITKMFIALSAIIPGLKKMDKMSILSDSIAYVKYLQNRIKDFEEQNEKRKIEYVACFKNKKVGDNISCGLDRPIKTFPNVEASVSGKDVLIRVKCDKRKDIVTKLMSKLAAHNLSIVCSNVMSFGNSALIITIITKVDREFNMAMDDLVKILNEDLLKWCNLQQ